VEHVIREQNILQANEILELFCELIVARLINGKDFVSTGIELRPNASVNRTLIEELFVKTPTGKIEWDTTDSEIELLKQLEERIEGPNGFVSATSLPHNSTSKEHAKPKKLPRASDD
ncbi:hypothetical protein H5410_027553, partial [Solanum commersonii]